MAARQVGRPTLYAHRGASSELPENTLPAFRRALEVGAMALETDAHLTRDGHVVLSHDPTVERTAGLRRAIADATLAEARAWDVGRAFKAAHPEIPDRPFTMPTLDEVLAELPGVCVNVDIKRHDAWAARAVVDVVRRRKAQDRVRLGGFDARTLRFVRTLGYEGATGLGVRDVLCLLAFPERALRWVGFGGDAAQIPPNQGPLRLDTPAFIAKAHALGLLVQYWTIDDPREAERLLASGADGIMSNDPARLAPLF